MNFKNFKSSESLMNTAKAVLPVISEDYLELFEMESERKLVGIRNTKLTCYINAVIQLIYNCKK
jgi:ubiquitin C-terminal hydrolase